MLKKRLSAALSLMLAVMVFMTFQMAFVQEASAASKKTKYVVTQSTFTAKYNNGETSKSTTKYTYFKTGLTKSAKSDDYASKFTRYKNGYIKTVKSYNGKGKLERTTLYTYKFNKKGLPVTEKTYEVKGSRKTLLGTTTNTYYGNGQIKKSVEKYGSSVFTITYNKKGDVKTIINKSKQYYSKESFTGRKYDKKGNPIKSVSTFYYKDGNDVYKSTTTQTYKNKYDKHNNLIKVTETSVRKDSTGTYTDKYTNTYKYKKVKVPKKYLKFF